MEVATVMSNALPLSLIVGAPLVPIPTLDEWLKVKGAQRYWCPLCEKDTRYFHVHMQTGRAK